MISRETAPLHRDYWIFGLRVRSMLELPELIPAMDDSDPDVQIDVGPVAEPTNNGPGLVDVDGSLVLIIPGVGRYRIQAGRAITIDADADVPDRNVRLFLLGSAFGALLHQRGLLPLHANAVEIDGRAFAFMGHSGAGKSTLAAWFHDNGYRVLADDVCVVRFDDNGTAIACPGLPRLRLWLDAIEFTGRRAGDFERSYVSDDDQNEKFDVPIAAQEPAGRELPLAAVYLLDRGDRLTIEPLQGIAAARAIFENTYRGSFLPAASAEQTHWHSALRLIRTTSIFRVAREWRLECLADQCAALIAHSEAVT
jgi:hypothetical protein